MAMEKCACKGIRTCLLCERDRSGNNNVEESQAYKQYEFCASCKAAYPQNIASHADHTEARDSIPFHGVHVIREFVTEEEETEILQEINKAEWVLSQSGRRKQDFGPKVNFKKQKIRSAAFTGLPHYSESLVKKLQALEQLKTFVPVELCNLEYDPSRGSSIVPHMDDTWLWGERLVTINLLSDTYLSFTKIKHEGQENNTQLSGSDKSDIEVHVLMPRRSLIVVEGEARYEWYHAIHRRHVTDLRLAMTFRELTPEFLTGGVRALEGKQLIDTALSFKGNVVK